MPGHHRIRGSQGHTLLELMLVLGVMAICAAAGAFCLSAGIAAQEARGAAQSWQAAAAWAQVGVVWQGGATRTVYHEGNLDLEHDFALCGGSLGASAPVAAATANVSRWTRSGGVTVTFTGQSAAPDGGGSVFFEALRNRYRVVVRPVSGLTARSPVRALP